MLPHLTSEHTQTEAYHAFLARLKSSEFEGDIASDLASRLTMATDNSVYQVLPQAVLYPKHTADIQLLFHLAKASEYKEVRFAPRGGGTGTDGQSLTSGIIIDSTRYMHQILEINTEKGFARVQPGVVLDQLNDQLKSAGLFFAPNVSPSSRATVGGMFSTDACGKGSCCYGRTSEHIIEAQCVLSNASLLESVAINLTQLQEYQKLPGMMGDIYRQINHIVTANAAEIEQRFPKLSRFMTGYNLAKVYDRKREFFNLNYLLAGSEGTLAFVTELTVKLTRIPTHTQLMVIQYAEFDDALCAARDLLSVKPTAIETIDDKVLSVAKNDVIYTSVKPMLEANGPVHHAKAINLVEFSGEDADAIQQQIEQLLATIKASANQPKAPLSVYVTQDAKEMSALWDLRKKSVGLLGNLPGNRRPIPFVEDTVVPPEHLAEYVREFRALLDSHDLQYGMFGHVDAGCLHVRPALDMVDPVDAALVPVITNAVNVLVKKYGGILWGEHGQGFRSQYAPDYFGKTLYQALRQIKTLFDPDNKLNPGKIASATHSNIPIVPVDGPMRGEQDRQIDVNVRQAYEPVMKCNGNGQCFQYDPNMVMCPSSKVTRDRVHSPKGRATVMREWLRLLAHTPAEPTPAKIWQRFLKRRANVITREQDFSQQVYQAMAGCLGCKGCSTACPVKVDIPRFKAQFLAHYHTRYPRSLRDHLVARSEQLAEWQSFMPKISNRLMRWSKTLLHKIGMIDLPKLSESTVEYGLGQRKIPLFSMKKLTAACATVGADNVVCIVPDALMHFYRAEVTLATVDLLKKLGFEVFVLPFRQSGKTFHVKGFIDKCKKIAEANDAFYAPIAQLGVTLVGIEPSITLTYRDEYPHWLGRKPNFEVKLLQEFLVQHTVVLSSHDLVAGATPQKTYVLFAHCSEKSLVANSQQTWQQVFAHFGLRLEIANVGCCGMAGSYGHETEHYAESKGIFELSWQARLDQDSTLKDHMLVTGFSCASQTKRFGNIAAKHPVEMLAQLPLSSDELSRIRI